MANFWQIFVQKVVKIGINEGYGTPLYPEERLGKSLSIKLVPKEGRFMPKITESFWKYENFEKREVGKYRFGIEGVDYDYASWVDYGSSKFMQIDFHPNRTLKKVLLPSQKLQGQYYDFEFEPKHLTTNHDEPPYNRGLQSLIIINIEEKGNIRAEILNTPKEFRGESGQASFELLKVGRRSEYKGKQEECLK